MLPTDASGAVVAGDIRAQTARALDNLSALLAKNGSRMAQVAAVTVYLRNQSDFAAMNEVYARYWPKDPPTRTTVVVNLVAPEALVEISMVALRDGVERRVVHPASWLRSPSPYSYAVQSGNTLFLAGLVSRNGKDNTAVPGDMKTQTQTVLQNAADILGAAGMTLADVVSSRVFITDTSMFQDMNGVYRSAFTSNPPARATVRAALIAPQYLVEITMLAVKDGQRAVLTTPERRRLARKAEPDPEFRGSLGQPAVSVRHARIDRREQERRRRPDARNAGPARPHAEGRRIRLGRRGGRGGLPSQREGLRRDELGVSRGVSRRHSRRGPPSRPASCRRTGWSRS